MLVRLLQHNRTDSPRLKAQADDSRFQLLMGREVWLTPLFSQIFIININTDEHLYEIIHVLAVVRGLIASLSCRVIFLLRGGNLELIRRNDARESLLQLLHCDFLSQIFVFIILGNAWIVLRFLKTDAFAYDLSVMFFDQIYRVVHVNDSPWPDLYHRLWAIIHRKRLRLFSMCRLRKLTQCHILVVAYEWVVARSFIFTNEFTIDIKILLFNLMLLFLALLLQLTYLALDALHLLTWDSRNWTFILGHWAQYQVRVFFFLIVFLR